MRYLCLLVGEPGMDGPVPGTPEFMQMLSDYQSATQAMTAAGVLVDSGPLQPSSAATTIRVRGGNRWSPMGLSRSSRSRSVATTCLTARTWTRRCGGRRRSRPPGSAPSSCARSW
jgi:hypothetical protein